MERKMEKIGVLLLPFGSGTNISYGWKSYFKESNSEEIKVIYQLFDEKCNALSPEVESIIYDAEKQVLLYEDSISLDSGLLVAFRFMTDLKGRQIGLIGNDYESEFDECTLLTGDYLKDKERYENYKRAKQKEIQEKINRNKKDYMRQQSDWIHLNLLAKKDIREA